MEHSGRTPEQRYGPALEKAQHDLRGRNPLVVANWAGVQFEAGADGRGSFFVRFWDATYTVRFPEGTVLGEAGEVPPISLRLLILHYLLTAVGAPLANRWAAFRDFPGGLGYNAAFDGRVNKRLAAVFGQRLAEFTEASRLLGGVPLDVGDAACAFDVFPRLRVAVVLYRGDDEFPASANLIFDAAADSYLPTEDLVVLGETVAGRLTGAKPPA